MAQSTTRQRILDTALALFNTEGVAKISTNHVADEMEISPGNLYYHFRNKDEIIAELFNRFEREIDNTLEIPRGRALDMEDMWLFLHLVFEIIWKYRFLYRSITDLLNNDRILRRHFRRILEHKAKLAASILAALSENQTLIANPEEQQAAAQNISIVASFWLSFSAAVSPTSEDESHILAQGIYQVMSLVAPLLRYPEREMLMVLARQYTEQ